MIINTTEYSQLTPSEDNHISFSLSQNDFTKLDSLAIGGKEFRIDISLGKDNPDILGLHYDINSKSLKVSYFVGIARIGSSIDEELILVVNPKFGELSPIAMLIEVLSHPIVSKHVLNGETFAFKFKEKPISVERIPSEYILFLTIYYMGILDKLVKRGLQKGYVKVNENLRGRVKGKVLVSENLRTNLSKTKAHYTYCSFHQYTEDTLENRILKTAFLKGKAYLERQLYGRLSQGLTQRIAFISSGFGSVPQSRIFPSDFKRVTYQKIRPDYKTALDMAEKILKVLGYDPERGSKISEKVPVYPYWINMNELFERYCEVKLRKGEILKEYTGIFAGYKNTNVKTGVGMLRPDFLLIGNSKYAIADAKYKAYEYEEGWIKEDIQQISLYGRIEADRFRDAFGIKGQIPSGEPNLYILYPVPNYTVHDQPNSIEGFRNIFKVGVPIISRSIQAFKSRHEK